ncbi:hypothetical protein COO60DRAFT_772096 [Scenedesmus sp. NREL 46B-D3]|nr:hypothetical protein COO60DRAFT_772096 [Scenedesmus sp. NREL 46B-D3]
MLSSLLSASSVSFLMLCTECAERTPIICLPSGACTSCLQTYFNRVQAVAYNQSVCDQLIIVHAAWARASGTVKWCLIG